MLRAQSREPRLHKRERELRTQFVDAETGRSLLEPLRAYNDFAKLFSCQVYGPDHLYWNQYIDLSHGMRLRVFGLTSTLLSGLNGNDTRETLYLSPLQTVLDPQDDVVNLVLCHHPPDWFRDQDDVNDAVCERALIQMFGHKHRQRITLEIGYVRFSAGAVNPDRYEPGWEPGYNIVDLQVVGIGPERALQISAHLLRWQTNPERFEAKAANDGTYLYKHRIGIPDKKAINAREPMIPNVDFMPVVETASINDRDVEAAMGAEVTRNLVFRFWKLTMSQRREIASRFDLLNDDERLLPEPERYSRALITAGKRGLLSDIAREVARLEEQ